MKTKTRNYKALCDPLTLRADMTQASARITYSLDGPEGPFKATPFQTANVGHDWTRAFQKVRDWLMREAG